MPRALAALIPFALAALVTPAVAGPPSVAVTFGIDPAQAAPGGEVLLRVKATLPDGWHIGATKTENTLPTSLKLTLPAGLEASGPLREPTPIEEDVQFVGPIRIHRGAPEFVQPLKVRADAAPGPLSVQAELVYQLCDDKNTSCVPGKLAGSADLQVVAVAPAGQPPSGEVVKGGDRRVSVVARLDPPRARPGQTVELVFETTVIPGWHIYATETPEGLPTKVELTPAAWLAPQGGLRADQQPKDYEVEFVGTSRIHEGKVVFRQPLLVDPAAAGELKVAGKLEWLACDEKGCEDGSLTFALGLPIEGSAVAPTPTPAPPAPPPVAPTPPPPAAAAPRGSLLGLTLAAIGLGIAMLLQPCNYPMIPITVSIFSKGRKLPRRQAVLRAGIYAAGIVISFVLVAGVLTVTLGAKGQGQLGKLATNPWLNLGIAALFVYFAFSFFGYYELGLPAPLQRLMQLGAAKRDAEGTVPAWSLFLMGFFFVLTSYTCGAPVVLALWTGAAATPHPLAIVYATFVFACTVALPYFALSLAPGAVRSLPKSGDWFSVFKAVLGFLELGFALKFVRTADVTLGLDLLGRETIYGAWAAISLLTAVYLLGYLPLRFPHDPQLRPPTWKRGVWSLAFLGLTGYFCAGAAGVRLWGQLETFLLVEPEVEAGLKGLTAAELAQKTGLPAAQAEQVIAAREAKQPLKTLDDLLALGLDEKAAERVLDVGRNRIRWGPLGYTLDLASLEAAQKRARETKQPVFLVFTGHACTNCQQMENSVLQEPRVVARLEAIDRVALFTDRDGDPEEERNRRFLVEKFDHGVLPAFYLLDGQGRVLAEQVGGTFGTGGLEQATQGFLQFLEKGGLTAPAP